MESAFRLTTNVFLTLESPCLGSLFLRPQS
jgi:hypothetical protein